MEVICIWLEKEFESKKRMTRVNFRKYMQNAVEYYEISFLGNT